MVGGGGARESAGERGRQNKTKQNQETKSHCNILIQVERNSLVYSNHKELRVSFINGEGEEFTHLGGAWSRAAAPPHQKEQLWHLC